MFLKITKNFLASCFPKIVANNSSLTRFDLPRSLAWVYDEYREKYGAKTDDFRADFFSMAGVFDNATRQMFPEIEKQLKLMGKDEDAGMVRVMSEGDLANNAMNNLLAANMSTERLMAWYRMERLVSEKKVGDNPYELKNGQLEGNVTRGADHEQNINSMSVPPGLTGIKNDLGQYFTQGALGALIAIMDQGTNEDLVREWLKEYGKKLPELPAIHRAGMLLTLIMGNWSLNDGQSDFVLKVLEASQERNDLVSVMDMVGQYDLMVQISLKGRTELTVLLQENYYPKTALNTIYSQVLKWENGQDIRDSGIQKIVIPMLKSRKKLDRKLIFDRLKKDGFSRLSEFLQRVI